MSTAAAHRLVEHLRAMRNAPLHELGSFARAVDALQPVMVSDTSAYVAQVARHARALAKQIAFAPGCALPAHRCALLMVSDMLDTALADLAPQGVDVPWHQKD